MDFDTIIYLILFIPLFRIIVFDQHNLNDKRVFIKYLLISIVILIFGIVNQYYSETTDKALVYFGSQMTFIFLILFKLVRTLYYLIYKREPEITRTPEFKIDFIVTFIVFMGTIMLPFIIDAYIVQKIME